MRRAFWEAFAESRMPMLVLDDDAVYHAVNDAACQLLGRSADDLVGRHLGVTTAGRRRAALYSAWEEFRRAGYIVTRWQIVMPDRRPVDVEVSCARDTPEPGRHLALCWPCHSALSGAQALSPREQEVTQLLADGLTGEQIAQRLDLSRETVRTHIRNAMETLGARTRAQLVALAVGRGMIPRPPGSG
jgi:PAS domain S-box-containing protein